MDESIIDDLKQFIQATVSQATASLATKQDRASLDFKVDQRFNELDLKLATIADAQAENLKDHENRLTTLEQRRAAA